MQCDLMYLPLSFSEVLLYIVIDVSGNLPQAHHCLIETSLGPYHFPTIFPLLSQEYSQDLMVCLVPGLFKKVLSMCLLLRLMSLSALPPPLPSLPCLWLKSH